MGRVNIIVLTVFRLVLSQMPDVEFTIREELLVSTEIGNLIEVPNLFHDLPVKHTRALQFDILHQGSSPAYLFNVTRNEGIISVARRIDREALCSLLENCVLIVNILASAENSSGFESKVITIYVKILDINDNYPTFQRISEIVTISEGSSIGTVVTISGAIDHDFAPEHRVTIYRLHNFHDMFSLSASKTLDGSSEIHLRLKKSLDRETNNKYEFTITACDETSPDVTSRLFVSMHVLDQNDNEPSFVNKTYSILVDSKLLLGEVVLQVSATDRDEGDNAVVTYDFSSVQKETLENVFRINRTTGEIFIIGIPQSGISEFIVEASDSGSPKLKTQAVVRVNKINNENIPPRVTLTTVGDNSDQNIVSVLEPGGSGFFVAFVLVDDDNPEHVNCQISSDVFVIMPVTDKGYKIVLLGTVDREVTPYFDLAVVCLDNGDPPLNATLQFRVDIQDDNDNAPVFSQRRYSRTISEGRKNGEYVIQVSARDDDIGLNGAVRYSLDSELNRLFSIDPFSGIISAVGDLDRELFPTLTFKVYATDQGNPVQKNTSAEVVIVLEDINDNFPEFTKKVFKIQTPEEVEGERIIGNLVANDADDGVNSQLEYFFIGSTDGAEMAFTVHKNGSVMCTTKLDREKKANYSFSVMVKDKGSPSLSSSATVIVDVTDINDNSPFIIFPKSHNCTIIISNLPETGTVLARIIAHDNDDNENSRLKFAIVSGNEDSAFEISENAGELKIEKNSRLKNNKNYDVCVIVSDNSFPVKFITTCLKINVLIGSLSQGLVKLTNGNKDDYVMVITAVGVVTIVFSTVIVITIWAVFKKGKKAGMTNVLETTSTDDRGNLSYDQKVINVTPENGQVSRHKEFNASDVVSHQFGEYDKSRRNGIYIPDVYPNSHSLSSKRKSVSFISEDPQDASSRSPHVFLWNDLHPFLTFSPTSRRSSDEGIVNPQAANEKQGDDVISDTSGDSMATDSGRGSSVDDVNISQSLKRDHLTSISSRRCNDDIKNSINTQTVLECCRISPNPFRFAHHSGMPRSLELPHPHKQSPASSRACSSISSKPIKPDSEYDNSAHQIFSYAGNRHSNRQPYLNTYGSPRQISITSSDNIATTTTSGSYIVHPRAIKIDAFVGADIFV